MRYAVISDIHANLEAFEAVLADLSKERIDRIACLGDIVGYGPDPAACIRLIKLIKPAVLVAGNHDWGAAGLVKLDYFSEAAREAVIWTKTVLGKKDIDFLKALKLVHEDESMTLVHATLNSPQSFSYILDATDAYPTIALMKNSVCFIGHTHKPEIYHCREGRIRYSRASKVLIDRNDKYVVNCGSVGQPRDCDPRASYVIYDKKMNTVEIKRTEYDTKQAQERILKAGLPAILAYRLSEGR